jgi:hypothetical protein
MKIRTTLTKGNIDFEINIKEYNSNDPTTFDILFGDTVMTLTKSEWENINNTVKRSMEFLNEMAYLNYNEE